MIFTELNASGYKHNGIFYNAEFEDVLSKVIACYQLMLSDGVSLSNNENSIRDVLLIKYLKNNEVRSKIKLTDYLFDREVPEDKSIGRTDIKIQTLNTFQDTNAYYIIECKRLNATNQNGSRGLNADYINGGICRFASHTYSMHYKTNGMIGFIVQPIDISDNVKSLNTLLQTIIASNTTQQLAFRQIVTGFDYSYCSTHSLDGNNVVIYHLMLDFSNNIQ